MTRIFYIIKQEDIMAKLIGFSENFRTTRPTFKISELTEIEPHKNPDTGNIIGYIMVHKGPAWSIGYQAEIRYFLDDGTFVDYVNDCDGQVQFLRDYLADNGYAPSSQKLEITSEVEFMDI